MGKREFPDALYIDLLSPESFRLYSASPERLKELIDGNPGKNPVIIDEVQKVIYSIFPAMNSLRIWFRDRQGICLPN